MTDETETKRGPGRPPKAQGFPCEVLRDYWNADGERIPAGTIVTLEAIEAMDAIEAKAVKRVK